MNLYYCFVSSFFSFFFSSFLRIVLFSFSIFSFIYVYFYSIFLVFFAIAFVVDEGETYKLSSVLFPYTYFTCRSRVCSSADNPRYKHLFLVLVSFLFLHLLHLLYLLLHEKKIMGVAAECTMGGFLRVVERQGARGDLPDGG